MGHHCRDPPGHDPRGQMGAHGGEDGHVQGRCRDGDSFLPLLCRGRYCIPKRRICYFLSGLAITGGFEIASPNLKFDLADSVEEKRI